MLLRDNVYRLIRRSILSCDLQPGQEVREQILAERYRVSRSPVRDALLRLEREHLVTVLPRQGYRINPVTMRDSENIYDLRQVIEPACAAAAAQADDGRLRGLDDLRRRWSGISDQTSYVECNGEFHAAIADLGGNGRMILAERELVEQVERVHRSIADAIPSSHIQECARQHAAILEAILARDVAAAQRTALAHVKGGGALWLAALRAQTAVLAGARDAPRRG